MPRDYQPAPVDLARRRRHRSQAILAGSAIGLAAIGYTAGSLSIGHRPPAPPDCCDIVTAIVTPGPTEIIGPPGSPTITEPTKAIIIGVAEAELGRPLTADELAVLDVGIAEGSGIGYAQGFGIGLEYVRRQVCNGPPTPTP